MRVRFPSDALSPKRRGAAAETPESMSDRAKRAHRPAYDPAAVEARRQGHWHAARCFRTPAPDGRRRSVYIKANAPFTSGAIHVGHIRSYSIADAYARFCRARGDAVLFTLGFDAFGLPAEQRAISEGQPPQEWVRRCRAEMAVQLRRMGFSFDWERSFATCEEEVYGWSQWLFLRLLDRGLIYRKTAGVDWCSQCSTTLAAMQVQDGRCWRCGHVTTILEKPHWYLRLSPYLQENEHALSCHTHWDGAAAAAQRGLLGRSEGVEIEALARDGRKLVVFTPHREHLSEACFVMVSPQHPDVGLWLSDDRSRRLTAELRSVGRRREERRASFVPVVDTGHTVDCDGVGNDLPVFVSAAVDARFGATAILGIPAVDHTDAVIAARLRLRPRRRLREMRVRPLDVRETVRYRTHDYSISRQRSWGTPIPVVHCSRCGVVPRKLDELPIRHAPDAHQACVEPSSPPTVRCPHCAGEARPETDTLDAHFDGLWIWIPACVPPAERASAMFSHPELQRWLPGERHIFGVDCSTYTFDQRIVAKILRDLGALSHLRDGEPFKHAVMHGMVTLAGRKMSKHLGNSIDPQDIVSRFGADALRLAVLKAAPPVQSHDWSQKPVEQCLEFLEELWAYAHPRLVAAAVSPANFASARQAGEEDAQSLRLARVCALAARRTTDHLLAADTHRAVRSVMRLLSSIRDFEQRTTRDTQPSRSVESAAIASALILLTQLLAPFAPHVAEELWLVASGSESTGVIPWPDVSV